MKKLVIKFGGTSMMDTERIKRVAQIIQAVKAKNPEHGIVVVVSAMGHTTDHLLSLADALALRPDSRELDLLLSTGEQVSASLLSIALDQIGIKAQSFSGALAGIVTDRRFGQAKIKHIHTEALLNNLAEGYIPVVAGFQGVSDQGQVTTLGRGGSDTTAIALAAALQAERCDIYSDVDGVYSADPRLQEGAYRLNVISYKEMHQLALNGAQILNPRAVEIAMRRNIQVRVRSTFKPQDEGTLVCAEARQSINFTSIACSLTQDYVRVSFKVPGVEDLLARRHMRELHLSRLLWKKTILNFLSQAGIRVEPGTVLRTVPSELHFCVERADAEAVRDLINRACSQSAEALSEIEVDNTLAKVSIVAREINSFIEVESIVALTKANIQISLMTSCEQRLSLFVPSAQRDRAVNILHAKFTATKIAA